MNLLDIEKMFESATYKAQLGNGALLEAWAQFHGRKLIDVVKATIDARRDYDLIETKFYFESCLDRAIEALEKDE
jgi:hypothetical protein